VSTPSTFAPHSFEQVVRDHQQLVFRTLARLTGRTDSLDDLAQDVFLRLFRALPGFRNEALVSTYLYRIAVNVAHDEWKRRRAARTHISLSQPLSADDDASTWEDRLEHPGGSPLASLQQREFQLRVEEHLNLLSHIERTILVLYHQEERSYQQIAETLQIPLGTVRTHLHRGRNKLKSALQQQEAHP
jgi:RNA polymerase sigma-70 factor (ECF subfamily)